MTIDKATMQQIIDRATEDPDFVVGLTQDAQGTLETVGIAVSAEDARAVGAALQASGESLAEPLQARISPASLATLFGGLAQQLGALPGHAAPAIVHEGHQLTPDMVHEGRQLTPDIVHEGRQFAPDIVHE